MMGCRLLGRSAAPIAGVAALVLMLCGTLLAKTNNSNNSVYVTDNCAAYDDAGSRACTVSEYSINAKSGALSAISGSPIQAPPDSEPDGIAVTPSGKFAYVIGAESESIIEYSRSSAGQLKPIGSVPLDGYLGSCPDEAAIDTSGEFLYVTDSCKGWIFEYSIDSKAGLLTALLSQPFTNASVRQTDGIAIAPNDTFVYVTDPSSRKVAALAIDKTGTTCGAAGCLTFIGEVSDTSSLTPSSRFRRPAGVAVDPSGAYVYVADTSAGLIASFAIDNSGGTCGTAGCLVAIDDNFTNLATPENVTVESSDTFVYVADPNGGFRGSIAVFSIDKVGTSCFKSKPGCVVAVSAVDADNGGCPYDMAIDPTGNELYATDICFNNVLEYSIDRSDCTGVTPVCLNALGGGLIGAGLEPKNIAVGDPPPRRHRPGVNR